jgi:hypothetical protein
MSTTVVQPTGEVSAVICTFNVPDHDGDIIRPSAVKDGTVIGISSWGHSAMLDARVPVGVGVLRASGNQLVMTGKLFLDANPEARAVLEVMKALGQSLEWSFGFRTLERRDPTTAERQAGAKQVLLRLDAFEVSPVFRGAGIGTRTIAAKRAEAEKKRGEQQTVLREIAARLDLAMNGQPVPAYVDRAVSFAKTQLGLRNAPQFRQLSRSQFRTDKFISEYDAKAHAVRIASDLPYETMVRAVFNEWARLAATEAGHTDPQAFATQAEGTLYARWLSH